MDSERAARELALVRVPPSPRTPTADPDVGELPAPVRVAPPTQAAQVSTLRRLAARLAWRDL
jgi:hypothetical protein